MGKIADRILGVQKAQNSPLEKSKKVKRVLMPVRIKRAKKRLVELSHTFVRNRDSNVKGIVAGFCCTCGKYCEGGNFQAGHYEPDSTGGVLLRFHPHNMHGQGGYCCNINKHGQQKMANEYTFYMIRKYGAERVEEIRKLKQKSIRGDILFYEKMIELYEKGDEQDIVDFLEHPEA